MLDRSFLSLSIILALLACAPAPPVGAPPTGPSVKPSSTPSTAPTPSASASTAPVCLEPLATEASSRLTVRVTGPDGTALNGAQVSILSSDPCGSFDQTQISQAGQVHFTGLPIDVELLVSASSPNLQTKIIAVTLVANPNQNPALNQIELPLGAALPNPEPTFISTPDPTAWADLSGTITDANGQAITGALISIAYVGDEFGPFRYVNSEAGRFQVDSLRTAEALIISVNLPGESVVLQQQITLQSNPQNDANLNQLRFQAGVAINPAATPWPRPTPTATPGIF